MSWMPSEAISRLLMFEPRTPLISSRRFASKRCLNRSAFAPLTDILRPSVRETFRHPPVERHNLGTQSLAEPVSARSGGVASAAVGVRQPGGGGARNGCLVDHLPLRRIAPKALQI